MATHTQAANPVESGSVPVCGVLESFLGHVQIFDASRTQVIDVTPKQKLLCGSWISVEDGVAEIRHLKGFEVEVGAHSFAQILDPTSGSNMEKDHFALLRGQMVLKSKTKSTLQVSTANARVKVSQAQAYLIYSTDYNETQLLGIEGQSEIQNRYLETRGIRVSQAQYSTLGFNPNRPTPTQPRVVAMKAVHERLNGIGVSKDLTKVMFGEAKALAQTQMPVTLKSEIPSRGLASVTGHPEFTPPAAPAQDHFSGKVENVISKNAAQNSRKSSHSKSVSMKKQPVSTQDRVPAAQSNEKQKLLKKLSEMVIEE